MQVAFVCCFRQGGAGMSWDLGRYVPDLEKLYARKLWADFSYPIYGVPTWSEGKKYAPKVFSALKTQVPRQAKKRLVYTKKLVFKGKRRKIQIHQRAFKVFVGDPFAHHWCIDFGLLPGLGSGTLSRLEFFTSEKSKRGAWPDRCPLGQKQGRFRGSFCSSPCGCEVRRNWS